MNFLVSNLGWCLNLSNILTNYNSVHLIAQKPLQQRSDLFAAELEVKEKETALLRHWEVINKHVVVPQRKEVEENPRSRSAKLRAAMKL